MEKDCFDRKILIKLNLLHCIMMQVLDFSILELGFHLQKGIFWNRQRIRTDNPIIIGWYFLLATQDQINVYHMHGVYSP